MTCAQRSQRTLRTPACQGSLALLSWNDWPPLSPCSAPLAIPRLVPSAPMLPPPLAHATLLPNLEAHLAQMPGTSPALGPADPWSTLLAQPHPHAPAADDPRAGQLPPRARVLSSGSSEPHSPAPASFGHPFFLGAGALGAAAGAARRVLGVVSGASGHESGSVRSQTTADRGLLLHPSDATLSHRTAFGPATQATRGAEAHRRSRSHGLAPGVVAPVSGGGSLRGSLASIHAPDASPLSPNGSIPENEAASQPPPDVVGLPGRVFHSSTERRVTRGDPFGPAPHVAPARAADVPPLRRTAPPPQAGGQEPASPGLGPSPRVFPPVGGGDVGAGGPALGPLGVGSRGLLVDAGVGAAPAAPAARSSREALGSRHASLEPLDRAESAPLGNGVTAMAAALAASREGAGPLPPAAAPAAAFLSSLYAPQTSLRPAPHAPAHPASTASTPWMPPAARAVAGSGTESDARAAVGHVGGPSLGTASGEAGHLLLLLGS